MRVEEGEEMTQLSPEAGRVLCLEAFICLLQVGLLGEVSGEGFSRMLIGSAGVPIGQRQARESLVIVVGSDFAHLVLLLFAPGAETRRRPRCHL